MKTFQTPTKEKNSQMVVRNEAECLRVVNDEPGKRGGSLKGKRKSTW